MTGKLLIPNVSINKLTVTVFSAIVLTTLMSCRECPTEQPDYDIYLSAEDVFCTTVVLSVTLPDSGDISTFALDRDDSTVATYTCGDDDTLIFDEGLTPDTDYIYRVRFLKDGKTKSESDPVSVHTMDTTSHDFVWEIYTLGIYGSTLYDIAIVSEDNIWAVGEIIVEDPDSSWDGTGREHFGAAHWNGEKWELKRFLADGTNVTARGIFIFSENDIWFACGSIYHYDGEQTSLKWRRNIDSDETVEKVWGTTSSNTYFVGNEGTIVHYDGSRFTKMESGSEISIVAVSGNSSDNIYFCHYDYWLGQSRILHYNGEEFVEIFASESSDSDSDVLAGRIHTIWVSNTSLYASCSSGIWQEPFQSAVGTMTKWKDIDGGSMHSKCISGQADNDIFVVGDRLKIIHYNGKNWMSYSDNFNETGVFESVNLKNDIVCAIGWLPYSGAIAVIGKRIS